MLLLVGFTQVILRFYQCIKHDVLGWIKLGQPIPGALHIWISQLPMGKSKGLFFKKVPYVIKKRKRQKRPSHDLVGAGKFMCGKYPISYTIAKRERCHISLWLLKQIEISLLFGRYIFFCKGCISHSCWNYSTQHHMLLSPLKTFIFMVFWFCFLCCILCNDLDLLLQDDHRTNGQKLLTL